MSSHFSQLSRSESSSTINSVLYPSGAPGRDTNGATAVPSKGHETRHAAESDRDEDDPFRWSVLQRISLALYPSMLPAPSKSSAKLAALALGQLLPGLKREQLGRPTKMVAGGLVCVGMSAGWVGVWDFRGEQKGWFGNEALRECLRLGGGVSYMSLAVAN